MFIEDFSTNFDEGKMSKLKLRQKVADVFQTADLVMGERPIHYLPVLPTISLHNGFLPTSQVLEVK